MDEGDRAADNAATMSTLRYSPMGWQPAAAPFDADDVLDALADDVLAEGDVRRALQRLMQRGLRGTRGGDMPGLRRIMDRLRERRQEELEQSRTSRACWTSSTVGSVRSCEQERAGIERRVAEAERDALDAPPGDEQEQARHGRAGDAPQRAAQRERPARRAAGRTWPDSCNGAARLRIHGPRGPDAFNQLTDELRQQLLETYFQGLKEGVAGVTPEDLDGVRDMVRDLNSLLEKHASGADTTGRVRRVHGRHGQYFPPGICNIDELIEHLHRQASQMASLLGQHEPADASGAASR